MDTKTNPDYTVTSTYRTDDGRFDVLHMIDHYGWSSHMRDFDKVVEVSTGEVIGYGYAPKVIAEFDGEDW